MRKLTIGLMAACLPLAASLMPSLAGPSATDWPAYGHDASGDRFSPLTQITPGNASKLQVAWTYHMNPTPGGSRIPTSTTTPLMVGGVIYLGTPYGRVVALDATTGQQVWAYQLPGSDQPPFRGMGYWPGDATMAPRIIFGSTQGKLIALDAKTGTPAKGFGDNGV
ncbi:MAG TPA: PQQ-binding-like beta-propeller repeat protein, partial [Rhizomicrobium sp.]|nr:PQQ-binding-like beta-propeller repeat protein [Rhizomicrobium sp.]